MTFLPQQRRRQSPVIEPTRPIAAPSRCKEDEILLENVENMIIEATRVVDWIANSFRYLAVISTLLLQLFRKAALPTKRLLDRSIFSIVNIAF